MQKYISTLNQHTQSNFFFFAEIELKFTFSLKNLLYKMQHWKSSIKTFDTKLKEEVVHKYLKLIKNNNNDFSIYF